MRTAGEVDAIEELLALPRGARLLDVGCGWGRHAVELAGHGFQVTGLDLSESLLREARNFADARDIEARWVRGDMRDIPFSSGFDAALSLFSSLGYFANEADDARVLRGIREALKPGGILLIETMHRDLIAREYLERDWWETPDGDLVRVEREFDAISGISHETLHWRARDGSSAEKSHTIRIRGATEWRDLLAMTGWKTADWFGGWDLDPFTHTSERLIIVARS